MAAKSVEEQVEDLAKKQIKTKYFNVKQHHSGLGWCCGHQEVIESV